MPVTFKNDIFHIYNDEISYCIELSKYSDLLHVHFGGRVEADEIELLKRERASFSAYEGKDNGYSLDVLPQEYTVYGGQDLRNGAFSAKKNGKTEISRLKYRSHEIIKGKPGISGMPAVYAENDDEFTTLAITVADDITGVELVLYYSISEKYPVICRHTSIKNISDDTLRINAAASAAIDFPAGDYKYMHLHGAWIREKHVEICDVHEGFQGIESRRGSSGPCENPFIALMDKNAGEEYGEVWGMSLVYSSNFKISMDMEQYKTLRVTAGINPAGFSWQLKPGEVFETPELVMVYSDSGLGKMSRIFHRLYRTRLCRGAYRDKVRPILINNWEATYFNFNEEKLLEISRKGAEVGMELFVLDDGWFGKRHDDKSSLGDWFVNTDKLPDALSGLAERVKEQGIKFGLWVEPEMISPDSDLFRKHPDWALQVADRDIHEARSQYVIDMSRAEVVDYLIDVFREILKSADITYVKWDFNRNLNDANSSALPNERQGEVMHRFMLGTYRLMDTLTSEFPHILFEGCSGGAGRNDPGILYYMPQNWGSDDTDAVERIYIQYGAGMVYPASTICSHVSTVPNHQLGRVTPMKLRGDVASSGVLGYEFDLSKLDESESKELAVQIERYKRIREVVLFGDLYRLINPFENRSGAWMYVAEDKSKAVVFYFNKLARPNSEIRRIKLKGLDPVAKYTFEGRTYSGLTLMNFGLYLPEYEKDFESCVWEINKVK
ncbi:MAG: alpha-galactosidase [bacterium]|nr:alpha-galactosidase [bacterium]